MKTKFAATALILASGLFAGTSSFAESSLTDADDIYTAGAIPTQQVQSGVTRAQVSAEFVAAHRTGRHEIIQMSRTEGLPVPDALSLKQTPSQVTRAQVQAELGQAVSIADQELIISGRDGGKCIEVHPEMHPAG
ncbi:MAG: DUF4148 domain-containing protein [Gammaproteobacteria bacterium]|uniref:DUF4148 domain-containing protein n=1 Tax=Rhodoferax sp. TaxID=50421 RepID=UPI001831D543|nr:DUF4148 domain-containing protein [Rhodoferax sp.]MBU3898369.1 DUF4148 domain-containing protein [Gammaproteobacteria bacterium]MBA3059366.1 DUF4148 domain-containing protein [Rhodoferax sp.]MBU3998088.1 DUF4148 domain-containing protein [Gammaproteobacteria bacterium]MBU4019610.1 DUF4148 domain-containing protein [Gammaproteobacteria bacterium]MBU4079143.1 DUF4148 domain-containing protein [Gammaproteobacteria bacterium]